MSACSPGAKDAESPIKVEIAKTADGYVLMRGGEPYTVKGAGMARNDIERFARHGGNSIRTWSTDNDYQDTKELLDAAHANDVTVALGLSMKAERHGFEYDDPDAVAAQLESVRKEVLKYRDHPALLFWLVGNELNHSYSNPSVWDAVNDAATMIHELDPNHPVTTPISGFKPDVIAEIQARAPAIDFISFQMYGSLFGLPDQVAATGFDEPFMMTEWGTIGYWEMEKTSWGAPTELTSSEKADVFLRAHDEILSTFEGQLIGSYAFFWGQKQERTPTWFGLLTESGKLTEAVDVMQYIWTGGWPANRTPRVESIRLDGRNYKDSVVLAAGESYDAVFDVADPEGDPLTYRWEVKPESDSQKAGGDREEALPNLEGLLSNAEARETTITVDEPGRYRLFAYAYDGQDHVAHANIPFLVEGNEPASTYRQSPGDLVASEALAVAYSGFREGQHPDRGSGAVNPSDAEILEDLGILVEHGFRLVRMYDAGENTAATLRLIREHDMPIKVLLGIWLDAEISNHEGCPWLDEPIPDEKLAANKLKNAKEIDRGIALANEYDDIVVAVNVGNEALVDWNDHMVPLEQVIEYVRQVKAAIGQPVTVADNYEWWKRDGAPLAAEVDFIGVHTYPVWESKSIDEALAYTIENVEGVRAALPGKPIAILEAGWATTATEFGGRANEADQLRYYEEMTAWAEKTNTTLFWFEAFDEPWKGDENDPHGAEKHWGLFFVDRTPKLVFRNRQASHE
ncbi:MAG TPA: glycoside hydrolase family 2 TIM barrel-domain containing protein [Woeseiaceae bacterium]|nr:glycoside hydrolase family 2 TIM barrel-domain containing protein [Woeseiaceae bacterium]